MSRASLAQLSYDAALHALEVQEGGVEQLRARTGTLLAATSLTASFLGAQTIFHTSQLGVLEIGALAALAVSILACVYVLLPKRGFVFSMSGPGIFEALYAHADDQAEVHRRLAYWLEAFWQGNQQKIEVIGRAYAIAAIALTAQLLLWSAALAAKI
jgi:hypothetical protein